MNDHCVMTTVSQPINHCTVWPTLKITVSWPLCDTHSRDYFALNYRNTYDISRKWQTTKDRQQKIQSYETVQLTRNPKKTIRFINVRKFFHFFGSFRRTRLYLEIGPKKWTDSRDCHWDLWFYQLFRSWSQSKGEKKCTFFQRYLQIDMGSYFQKGSISK